MRHSVGVLITGGAFALLGSGAAQALPASTPRAPVDSAGDSLPSLVSVAGDSNEPAAGSGGRPDSETPPPPPEITLALSGFISATAFAQDESFGFGNGQSALFATGRHAGTDPWLLGGDVRNTRLRLTADTRTEGSRWKARGILEVDFFGAFNGTGAFNDEQPQPRLRLAYVELIHGGTTLRVGQSWTPLFGAVPVSVGHVAFPLGLGSAGLLGWRYPGLLVLQQLTGDDDTVRVGVQIGAYRGSWSGTDVDDPAQVIDHRSAGEAGIPQFEARVDVAGVTEGGERWSGYVVGHIDRKDLSGVGTRYEEDDRLVGWAAEMGGRLERGDWTVHGNAHVGRAVGQQFAAITQFGDIGSAGGWMQVGYDLTPDFNLWLFHGLEDPVDDEVRASGNQRLLNRSSALLIEWDAGTYRAGLEWLRSTTRWTTGSRSWADLRAQQISFSVMYAF